MRCIPHRSLNCLIHPISSHLISSPLLTSSRVPSSSPVQLSTPPHVLSHNVDDTYRYVLRNQQRLHPHLEGGGGEEGHAHIRHQRQWITGHTVEGTQTRAHGTTACKGAVIAAITVPATVTAAFCLSVAHVRMHKHVHMLRPVPVPPAPPILQPSSPVPPSLPLLA